MKKPLVRMVKLNGLQYNANRDPQAYRRTVGELFSLQALLDGSGEAKCSLTGSNGLQLASGKLARPGLFSAELRFDTPGSRLVTLRVTSGAESYEQTLRLDALAAEPMH
ncbi:MAG TPA: hypothetical protein VNE59_08925 [Burkholderiales bacterium]|nr:hypothetical protein [Burkholderiales bacterium]